MQENKKILELIGEYLDDMPEAKEVANYVITRVATDRVKEMALKTGMPELRTIHPASQRLVDQYERGFVRNPFYDVHQVSIRASLFIESNITTTLFDKMNRYAVGERELKDIVKTLLADRYRTVILVVGLAKGWEVAQEFSGKFLPEIQLLPEEIAFIDNLKVVK